MKNPLVSILIPAFNAERFVAEAIHSALGQTWAHKEIIVVDDGSTDRTLLIARQFVSDSVTVVTQTNQGAAAARNKALEISRGDYLQWLDADDLLAPEKISRQIAALGGGAGKRILLSGPWGSFVSRPDRAKFRPSSLWIDSTPVEWLLRKLEENLFMQTGTWLVSRELTEAAGPWDPRLLSDDDGEYFNRVLLASDGIRFVSDARMFYRASGAGGLSHVGQSEKKLQALFTSLELHVRYLRSLEESERVRAACIKFLQGWFLAFYPESKGLIAQVQQLAEEIGGRLETPKLSWKYAWIQKLFGWTAAKRAQTQYNQFKSSVMLAYEKVLHFTENQSPEGRLRV